VARVPTISEQSGRGWQREEEREGRKSEGGRVRLEGGEERERERERERENTLHICHQI